MSTSARASALPRLTTAPVAPETRRVPESSGSPWSLVAVTLATTTWSVARENLGVISTARGDAPSAAGTSAISTSGGNSMRIFMGSVLALEGTARGP